MPSIMTQLEENFSTHKILHTVPPGLEALAAGMIVWRMGCCIKLVHCHPTVGSHQRVHSSSLCRSYNFSVSAVIMMMNYISKQITAKFVQVLFLLS